MRTVETYLTRVLQGKRIDQAHKREDGRLAILLDDGTWVYILYSEAEWEAQAPHADETDA